ncbi:PREDICTED: protein TIPIN homolog [Dinoponera quadriceps]|uniref:TIMELESS-interacting protein n=1 Tax=Dinoponera quadriceps TaxID=609295 RepID=A0A6P3WT45_DINQU|nr:PREDICTED: protein TIPIN homolog [Dinoponera quadriceps]
MANTSDYDGDEDIIAHYEDQEANDERGSFSEAEEATSDNDKDNEAGTKRKIDPSTSKAHTVRNPLPKLNTERLKGPNGIGTIEKYFEGFKFYGKGHEKLDLDRIMKRLEHWSHRLFPKYHFDDFLTRVEQLGAKKDLQVYIKKYRLDMITADDDLIVHDNMDDEEDQRESAPLDDFDLLITEQIQKQKQTKTQVAASAASEDAFNELLMQSDNISSPQVQSTSATGNELSDEMKEKIERNKQLAVQRRLQRQNERDEIKKKKLAESTNAEALSENSNLTVNHGMDVSQVDDIQPESVDNINKVTRADKSEINIE